MPTACEDLLFEAFVILPLPLQLKRAISSFMLLFEPVHSFMVTPLPKFLKRIYLPANFSKLKYKSESHLTDILSA